MSYTQASPLVALLAEDRTLITYRPRLNSITGSVLGTILLQQMVHWWLQQGRKPFYKFMAPCGHEKYRPGDSWQEELGFTRSELNTALGAIGKKISKGVSKNEALKTHLVLYWTDRNRVTWYMLNEALLHERLLALYNAGIQHYINSAGNQHYIGMAGNQHYQEKQETGSRYSSETTTETNHRDNRQHGRPTAGPAGPVSEKPDRLLELMARDSLTAQEALELLAARQEGKKPGGQAIQPAVVLAKVWQWRYGEPGQPRRLAAVGSAWGSDWEALAMAIANGRAPQGDKYSYWLKTGYNHRREAQQARGLDDKPRENGQKQLPAGKYPWPEDWGTDPHEVAGLLDAMQRDLASQAQQLPAWWFEAADIVREYLPASLVAMLG